MTKVVNWDKIPQAMQDCILEIVNNRRTRFTTFDLKPITQEEMHLTCDALVIEAIIDEILIANLHYEEIRK